MSLRNKWLRFETSGKKLVTDEPNMFGNDWLKFVTLKKLPFNLEEIQNLVLKTMQDE